MKNKIKFLLIISLVGILSVSYFQFVKKSSIVQTSKIERQRAQYENYLLNSPFKETLLLSKSERKEQGIPPNKYYEREWELTMNPSTGLPEPNKVLSLQKLRNSTSKRVPGDGDVTNNWVDRGPNNVGGRTRVVLFDPNDTDDFNRVFAGAVSGGLWVNEDITDVNSSWVLVPGVPSNMNISCITVDPNNSQIWYIGTGEQYTYGAAAGNGVYKTTDGGATWKNIPVQLAGGGDYGSYYAGLYFINAIVAWDNEGSTELFLGVGCCYYNGASNPQDYLGYQNTGLYRSVDNGTNWNRIETPNLLLLAGYNYYIVPNDFEIGADNTLWMGSVKTPASSYGGGKVFSSSDGINWIEAQVSPLPNSDRVELAVSSTDKDKIYALTSGTTSDGPHIYATDDSFTTFTELTKPKDADLSMAANDFTKGQAFYNLVIEVYSEEKKDDILYVGGIDLFKTEVDYESSSSTSYTLDWKQISKWSNNNNLSAISCSKVHADQHAFTFRPNNGNQAVIGCDGGVYFNSDLSEAENSATFSVMNKDYNITQFYYGSYGQDVTNERILAGAQDNGTQYISDASEGANSSVRILGGDGTFSEIHKDGDYMIASYVYSTHYYLKLPYIGVSEYVIDNTFYEGDFINQAELDHNLNILYSNGSNKINRFKLGDTGLLEGKVQLSNGLLNGSPTAFKVSPFTTTSTTLFVGTGYSELLKITNADETTGAITWEKFEVPFVGSVSDIEFGTTENEIYVTIHNYSVTSVWYSANGGLDWENKEGNLPDMPIKCILPSPLNTEEVIVGTELGLWATKNFSDENPTWVSSFNGMRDVKVVDLDLRTADNSILATTHGRGVFTGKFSSSEFTISSSKTTIVSCANEAVFNFDFNTYPAYTTKTNFSVVGIPEGVSETFSISSLSGVGIFSMTVSNISSLAVGDYPFTVIGNGLGANSIDVVLKIVDPSTIGTVVTTAPLNGAANVATEAINFEWNAINAATSYLVEISTDAGFNTIIESGNSEQNSYQLQSVLNLETVYYWRVSAINDCVTGEPSEGQSFQTEISCHLFKNSTSIPIPDGAGGGVYGLPATSVITIPSSILISDVNITVDISHTYIGDLKVILKSPSDTEIVLFEHGCSGENSIQVIYDDAGLTAINCGSLIQWVVTPLYPLSVLNSEDAQGDWTLAVVDNWNNDIGTLNSWAIEVCEAKTAVNSKIFNKGVNVATNSPYVFKPAVLKASSAGSKALEQVFMVTQLPTNGTLILNGNILSVGETFTQDAINTGKILYSNTSGVSGKDSFKVDITNATSGYVPNQEILINIDSSLNIHDNVLDKSGVSIFPTVSNGAFSILAPSLMGQTQIEIFALSGQRVYNSNINFNSVNIEKILVKELASGVYILKFTSEEIIGTKKIIIQ